MNSEQKNFFMKNGYCIINNFIETNFCDSIYKECQEKIKITKSNTTITLSKECNLKNNKKFLEILNDLTLNRISKNQKINLGNTYIISSKTNTLDKGYIWHIDGYQYKSLNQEESYTCVIAFSDIEENSGTFLALDSVKLICNILKNYNEINPELFLQFGLLTKYVLDRCKNIIQIKLKKGDLLIMHPFLLHSRCNNFYDNIRIIKNFSIRINNGMNLNNNSLVETKTKMILNSNNLKILPKLNTKYIIRWNKRNNYDNKKYYYKNIKPILVSLYKKNIVLKQNKKYMCNDYSVNENIIDKYNINLYKLYKEKLNK